MTCPFYNGQLLLVIYTNTITFWKSVRFSKLFSGLAGRNGLKFSGRVLTNISWVAKHFFVDSTFRSKMADHFHFQSSIFKFSASKIHILVSISKTALTIELLLGSNDPYNWRVWHYNINFEKKIHNGGFWPKNGCFSVKFGLVCVGKTS